jgi:hypothetical protein
MTIKLKSVYAGPRGVWQRGMVMDVGRDIAKAEALGLVAAGFAMVMEPDTETADEAPPETAMVQTSGKKARGR